MSTSKSSRYGLQSFAHGLQLNLPGVLPVLLLAAVVALSGSGCISTGAGDQALNAYTNYLAQDRTYKALEMEVQPGQSLTINGLKKLTVNAPLQALSAMPRDPNLYEKLIDKGGNVIMALAGMNLLSDALSVQGTVTEASVVRPDVYFIPEGAAAGGL